MLYFIVICLILYLIKSHIETEAEYTETEHSFSLLYDNDNESINFSDNEDHSISSSETDSYYLSSDDDDDSLTVSDDRESEHEMEKRSRWALFKLAITFMPVA